MGAALFLSTRYAVWVTLRDPVIGTRYSIDIIDYPLLSSPRLMEISAPVAPRAVSHLSLSSPTKSLRLRSTRRKRVSFTVFNLFSSSSPTHFCVNYRTTEGRGGGVNRVGHVRNFAKIFF